MLKYMQHPEEVSNVTLGSEDNERIRAHKVVLSSVSTPSGPFFRMMTRLHTMKLFISKDFFSKFMISGVQCRIYGE